MSLFESYFTSPKLVLLQLAIKVKKISIQSYFICVYSNIFFKKWNNTRRLISVMRTWRVNISMTAYLLEGRLAAIKACLQAPPPFPIPRLLLGFLHQPILFFAHTNFFSPFSPNVEPGPRLVAVFPHCVSLDNSVDFFGINHMPARSCCFLHIIRSDPTEGSPTRCDQWACASQ